MQLRAFQRWRKFRLNEEVRNNIRRELGIENKKVIGHVGRFNPQKNHEFLIDIFNEIYKKDKDTVLLLIGDGYLKEKIEEKVNKLELDESVKFLGVREDIPELMQAMDLFLFPSQFEGLAVVMVEAQAAGLKVITSTGVTTESNITENVEFIELNKSAKYWADIVLNSDFKKKNDINLMIKKGYDSTNNVKWLSDFYLKKYV